MANFEYEVSGPSLHQLEESLDELWASLGTDRDLMRRAEVARINLKRVPPGERARLIKLRRKGAGFEPGSTAVVVGIGLGAKILRDIWTHLLLPRLRKKYGADALKEKEAKKEKKEKKS